MLQTLGVVGQPVPQKSRCIVQPRVALLLNHLRSVRDGLLQKIFCTSLQSITTLLSL